MLTPTDSERVHWDWIASRIERQYPDTAGELRRAAACQGMSPEMYQYIDRIVQQFG